MPPDDGFDSMAAIIHRAPPVRVSVTTPDGEQTYAELPPCQICGSSACPCPKCHGAEWVLPRRDENATAYLAEPLIPCDCAAERIDYERIERVVGKSGMEKERKWSFERYPPRSGQEDAWAALKRFSADPYGWVFLWGEPGVGKTTLAFMAANAELNRGKPVLFIEAGRVLMKLDGTRQKTGASHPTTEEVSDSISSHPFVVIDEYGRQRSTDYANEHFHTILNYRYRQRLPTIITTNMKFSQLDEALAGRVREAATVDDDQRIYEVVSVEKSRQRSER